MTEFLSANDERAPNERPVSVVAPQHLTVEARGGSGTVPLFATGEWNAPQPGVERAVILIHGRLRNADAYFQLAHRARTRAGRNSVDTLLIVPQFLAAADVDAHHLPASTLRWEWIDWMGGGTALAPAPLSSFDVLDTVLAQLADPRKFPDLREVVVAGHSGGGQVVQRYAVLVRGDAALAGRGVALRYVIANPSSYVYFDTQRPLGTSCFARYDEAHCAGFNRWKYGLDELPAYARDGNALPDAAALEAAYVHRDVTLLLGANDCDPAHPALDRSCAALAQGPHRLARGRAYTRYMGERHPQGFAHRTIEIDGAGHDADAVFGSPAGLAALFGEPVRGA
ncbi:MULTISPECIES: alpha/beta hydrolase [Burkholderiaceae]|uniref:alpha/beta hydrolase n=1 Tax=Burkholderiaceae TaxID=119060 RepID=UPI001420126F|nr:MULTISPECIES: alpha/beta hydrolase [Burkholderiaceae]MBN3846569.1 alpha/beta hydrolase [Paraburkholderia sp. Ac-20342]NIF55655.1 alpha/beta hydrolase [Burkholderia sp. Ax-1724]NIF77977.1 alpha/beta hydrolase [Paraburkholderia sp. Cy-641]